MTKQWWEFEEGGEKQESDFYSLKTGDNKVRILTEFVRVNQLVEGDYPNTKLLGMVDDNHVPKGKQKVQVSGWAWAIIRETGEVKILKASKGVLQKIAGLRANEEYSFDGFPMPYDINIHNTGDGPNRYSITPARKNTEVTEEEMAKLEKKTPLMEIIEKIKSKKQEAPTETVDYPERGDEEIPF